MAYSFYGGKEGISFIIKETYMGISRPIGDTNPDHLYMLECFAQGGQYNDVGYGEFVIISTPDKANFENGCVFRRDFDYDTLPTERPDRQKTKNKLIEDRTNPSKTTLYDARVYWEDTYDLLGDTEPYTVVVHKGSFKTEDFNDDVYTYLMNVGAGARYIGCIAGPEGAAAPIEIVAWNVFTEKYNQAEEGDKQTNVLLSRTSGKETDNTKTGYCTLRDANGNISHSYFSLDIPYDVFEIQAESASPYGPTVIDETAFPTTDIQSDTYYRLPGSIVPVASSYQPVSGERCWLYENNTWIPREPWTATPIILGDKIVDYDYNGLIREKQESEGHPFYYSYDIKVPKGIHGQDVNSLGIYTTGVPRERGHDVVTTDENHNYQLYYRTTDYGAAVPSSSTIYTGTVFNTIDGIETDEQDATYPVRQNNTQYTVGQRVSITENPDLVLVCSKEGTSAAAAPVDFNDIKKDYHLIDGTVIWTVVEKEKLAASKMTVYYTKGDHANFNTRLLDSLEMDDDGKVYAKYTDITERSYIGDNKQILGIDATDNIDITKLKVKYNTYKYNNLGEKVLDDEFKYYNGSLAPIGTTVPIAGRTPDVYPTTDSQCREIQYLTELGTNDIVATAIVGHDLLVLYSDPEKRKNLTNPYRKEYNGQMYDWANLGHLTSGEYTAGTWSSIEDLRHDRPYGLGKDENGDVIPEEQKYIGWLISIINTETSNGTLYYYNYFKTPQSGANWTPLESFAGTKPENITIVSQCRQGSIMPVSGNDTLAEGGLWFVVTP